MSGIAEKVVPRVAGFLCFGGIGTGAYYAAVAVGSSVSGAMGGLAAVLTTVGLSVCAFGCGYGVYRIVKDVMSEGNGEAIQQQDFKSQSTE